MVSKEGDHERGTYLMKTGYRPDPTVEHPSIGAICCHELPVGRTDIPRHISILPGRWPGRGGFLGGEFDAFQVDDPGGRLPDVTSPVAEARERARVADLEIVERAFGRGRRGRADSTLHRETLARARTMMTSEQLRAFDVAREPAAVRAEYGETPFGRGCLAARRLIEVGVRCVEVTLGSWDAHVNNHEIHRARAGARPGVCRAAARPRASRAARSDRRPLRRRVRPDPEGQRAGRPRPLAPWLQPGDRRRRPPRRPGDRRDRSGRARRPRPADHDRGRARHHPHRAGTRPRPREYRAGVGPADQAQRRSADPRAAGLTPVSRRASRPATPPRPRGCRSASRA